MHFPDAVTSCSITTHCLWPKNPHYDPQSRKYLHVESPTRKILEGRSTFFFFCFFCSPVPSPSSMGVCTNVSVIKSHRSPHRLSPVCFLKGGELEALGGQLVVVSVRPTWYPDNSDSKHWLCPLGALSCGLRAISPPPSRPTWPNISHFALQPLLDPFLPLQNTTRIFLFRCMQHLNRDDQVW